MTDQVAFPAAPSQLVLSLFPGVDLLGRGFEAEGFSVVRGPDLIYGGDIRQFRVVAGRFDGVIGGPPCPDFSKARRSEPSGYGLEMLAEFRRVVLEARPTWWLMENVAGVPDVMLPGYSHQRIDINASECGLQQNRLRHFQFGHGDGLVLTVKRLPVRTDVEPCCTASEGSQLGKRDWLRFCQLQGLRDGIDLPAFTLGARYRAVGNGVPVDMAKMMASGILSLRDPDDVKVCECGCGREVEGRARLATPACRKRQQRKRDSAGVIRSSSVTL
ncbi:DNA cytosine methyltransferase [Chromobacterium haemolyticum]|uniref:DNA cytosine methyltransferase n=1 Tax=Chromobacterium haemolyticum TaxID=394935 RepID=UPI0015E7D579|nr:DNA cytosine methyltransferase [Chromobacterium haemolyticum]